MDAGREKSRAWRSDRPLIWKGTYTQKNSVGGALNQDMKFSLARYMHIQNQKGYVN